MNKLMPSAKDIQLKLSEMPTERLRVIAEASGVPFTTLWKIKTGETANPGIETVRRFFPLMDECEAAPSAAPCVCATQSVAGQAGA